MLCKYCGEDTKDRFPYCMNCGEWIGTGPSKSGVPGSWGNREFDSRPRKMSLLRKEGEEEPSRSRWPAGEVPAARLRYADAAMDEAVEVSSHQPGHPASRGWYLHWRRA